MSQLQEYITQHILPRAQQRIAAAVGKDIPITVAFDTVVGGANHDDGPDSLPATNTTNTTNTTITTNTNTGNSNEALRVLSALGGHFVLMRLALVMEALVAEYDAATDLQENLMAVRVMHRDPGEVTMADGTLHLSLPLLLGVGHLPSQVSLQKKVAKALRLAGRKQRQQVDRIAIPEAQSRIQEVLGIDVPIHIEWDSIYDQPDFESAMHYLSCLRGHYVLGRAASALYQTVAWEDRDRGVVASMVKQVRVRGLPGEAGRERYVTVRDDGVLDIACAFSSWAGIPHVYEMKMMLCNACLFHDLDQKLTSGDALTAEDQERKLDALADLARREPVVNGRWSFLRRALEHRCFFQPDAVEQTAMDRFMEHYAGHDPDDLRRTKKERWGDLKRVSEDFIHGWRINKINHRGQEQLRLAVLTTQAFYTFKWNYKKEEPELRRTHRISHDDFGRITWGKLRPASAGNGVAGAAADAVAGEGEPRYGVRYRTELVMSRKESLLKESVSKFLKGKEVTAIRSLADKQLGNQDELPDVDIPDYRRLTPHGLCQLTAQVLGGDGNGDGDGNGNDAGETTLPETAVLMDGDGGEEAVITAADVFAMLTDSLEAMEKEPELVTLPNAPNLKIDAVFNQVLDILDDMDNLGLDFPTNVNLAVITRKITDVLSNMSNESIPKFQLPKPEPLTVSQIAEAIEQSLSNRDSSGAMPSVEVPGRDTTLASIEDILATLKDKFGDRQVEFPVYPSSSLISVVENIGAAFGDMSNLPDMDLLDLSVGGTTIKSAIPSLNVDVPGGSLMRKLRGEEPRYFEMIFEPVVSNSDLVKPISKEIAWSIYGALRAYHTPYYVITPWDFSINLPNTHVGTLYNKMGMGNDKKPDGNSNENNQNEESS